MGQSLFRRALRAFAARPHKYLAVQVLPWAITLAMLFAVGTLVRRFIWHGVPHDPVTVWTTASALLRLAIIAAFVLCTWMPTQAAACGVAALLGAQQAGKSSLADALQIMKRNLLPALLWTLCIGGPVFFASMILIFPGLLLASAAAMIAPVAAIDGAGALASVGRGLLMARHTFRPALFLYFVGGICALVLYTLGFVAMEFTASNVAFAAIMAATFVLIQAIIAVVNIGLAQVYLDTRRAPTQATATAAATA
jgi:uncharacterized membrane protein (DUF485 family)